MMKRTNLQRIGSLVLVTIALLFISDIQAFAQKKDYKPGEKIEYNYGGTWKEGTFVRASDDGKQPLIREKPNEIYKEGYEMWWQWDQIRPLSAKPANQASVNTNTLKTDYKPGEKIEYLAETYPKEVWEEGTFIRPSYDGKQPIIRQKPNEFQKDGFETGWYWEKIRPLGAKKTTAKTEQKTEETEDNPSPTETTKDFGTGLMSQADVLSFVQTKLGDNPSQNPRRDEIKKELVEMIKARGLDFRFETNSDFYSKLNKYVAMTSDMVFPLHYNFGAPTKESWLTGSWQLSKTGAAVDYEKDGRIYREGEIAVGGIGALTIKADGTYVWKTGAKDSTSGKWRKATKEEMREQGGDGIVLLKAKGGEDWIVMHDRWTTLKGNWINIYQLNWRQIKERGWRGGKK